MDAKDLNAEAEEADRESTEERLARMKKRAAAYESDLHDYNTPAFNSIWRAVRRWDIERTPGEGYAHATGDDVQAIIDALREDGLLA